MQTTTLPTPAQVVEMAASLKKVREGLSQNRHRHSQLGTMTPEDDENYRQQEAELDVLGGIVQRLSSRNVSKPDLIRFIETLDRMNAIDMLRMMPRPTLLS